MRVSWLAPAMVSIWLAGCLSVDIKPAEAIDESTGVTVAALQEPIELVENPLNASFSDSRRTSFAYLGPVEWDRTGEITYGVWIHVAPGTDKAIGDIHGSGAVTLELDDGPMVLVPMDAPELGRGPYKPVVSWGQTSYFTLDPAMLKRMASSRKFSINFLAADASPVDFLASHDTRATLTEFARTRGITDD